MLRVFTTVLYRVVQKVALHFCPYLRQLLIDFQNFLTGTLCRQFAIIPPDRKCVSILPCEISMKITIITNKHFGEIKKKTLQPNITVNGLYDTKLCGFNCVGLT